MCVCVCEARGVLVAHLSSQQEASCPNNVSVKLLETLKHEEAMEKHNTSGQRIITTSNKQVKEVKSQTRQGNREG